MSFLLSSTKKKENDDGRSAHNKQPPPLLSRGDGGVGGTHQSSTDHKLLSRHHCRWVCAAVVQNIADETRMVDESGRETVSLDLISTCISNGLVLDVRHRTA